MKRTLYEILGLVFGSTIYALGIVLFVLPVNLITGGSTGLALILNHYFKLDISMVILAINVVTFILGAIYLGAKFSGASLISIIYFPFALGFFQRILKGVVLTTNPMLATLFAGVFIGLSLGLVLKMGGSTGGLDIPPLILHKYFKIPVSVSLYVIDVLILLGQFSFLNSEKLLYGIVLVFIYTFVMEEVMIYGKQKIEIKVVSEHSKEIKDAILKNLDRGVTIIYGKTGYLENDCEIVLSVISNREIFKVERIMAQYDSNAFMIVSSVKEVHGFGFTKNKRYLD